MQHEYGATNIRPSNRASPPLEAPASRRCGDAPFVESTLLASRRRREPRELARVRDPSFYRTKLTGCSSVSMSPCLRQPVEFNQVAEGRTGGETKSSTPCG